MPSPQTAEEAIGILERIKKAKNKIVNAQNELYLVLRYAEKDDAAALLMEEIKKGVREIDKIKIGIDAIKNVSKLLEDGEPPA
jgi:hypothetical protein